MNSLISDYVTVTRVDNSKLKLHRSVLSVPDVVSAETEESLPARSSASPSMPAGCSCYAGVGRCPGKLGGRSVSYDG